MPRSTHGVGQLVAPLDPLHLPLPEWELWACAHTMIRQYGGDALIFAAMRADALLLEGEAEGAANWRLIVHRTNALLSKPEITH